MTNPPGAPRGGDRATGSSSPASGPRRGATSAKAAASAKAPASAASAGAAGKAAAPGPTTKGAAGATKATKATTTARKAATKTAASARKPAAKGAATAPPKAPATQPPTKAGKAAARPAAGTPARKAGRTTAETAKRPSAKVLAVSEATTGPIPVVPPPKKTFDAQLSTFLERIDHPLTTYHMLLAGTATLLVFGLVMVMSAASISSYSYFGKQALYAAIGVALAAVASRIPVPGWKRLAVPFFLVAFVFQCLVLTPLGEDVQGNRGWVKIAGQSFQPSEFAKLALVVFGAFILDRKRKLLGDVKHVAIPFVFPATLALLGVQLYGNDLGTGMVLLAIVAGMLYAAGLALRWFAAAAGFGIFVVLAMAVTSQNRTGRIDAWIGDGCKTNQDLCRQVNNGFYALAGGGWWGAGLGNGQQKWGWLSESKNDFILAIVGEELGLPGTLTVLALYALVAYACLRLVLRSRDLFVRLASAGVMVWLAVQAAINIGAVTGLLPVIGVPLPLISGGGTALISVLLALGMLMGFARHEPGAQAAIAARKRGPHRKVTPMSSASPTPSTDTPRPQR